MHDWVAGGRTTTKDAFALLKPEVERHEGLTGASNSHYGIWQDSLRTSHVPEKWEALVGVSASAVKQRLDHAYKDFTKSPSMTAAQHALDVQDDMGAIRRWSGNCEFIYQP